MTTSTTPIYFQTTTPIPPPPPPPQPPTTTTSPPPPTTTHPIPKPPRKPLLRLEIRDLSSPGAQLFLTNISPTALQTAVYTVLLHLYTHLPTHCIPPTRSVTLVLRALDGVAYTTGTDLDTDHKEIHLSTGYISSIDPSRVADEITGVIVHEMVHCFQHDARGTAPGGLIEGIADWVRLKAGFAPPHWKRRGGGGWDRGYEVTGFFLEWLEKGYGGDVVKRVNEGLRCGEYVEGAFWRGCCGKCVGELWEEYCRSLKEEGEGDGKEGAAPAPALPSCVPFLVEEGEGVCK